MAEKAERTTKIKLLKKAINFGLLAVFAFLFFWISSSPVEAGNQQLTFQGKLTNSSGNSVTNGTYYVKLTIYDAATGGSCQYTASSTCSSVTSTPVTVTNGIFSINLGDTSASLAAISPTLFNSSALYLGITVCSGAGTGCDSEMTPRKRITAAPYAFNADYLSGLATSTIGGQSSYVPVTDSSGNFIISNKVFVATTTAGQFGVGTSTVPSGVKSYVEGTTATDKLLVIRGNSSQSGNLQEWQNSVGTALVTVNSSGNVSTSGTLAILSAASSTISSALGINSSTPSRRLVVNGGSDTMVGIFEQNLSSNTAAILQLINYDGANTDKTLDFVLPGGSTAGTIQGLSAANRASIKATSDSLVIGAGSVVDALAFSLSDVPVLIFDGVNNRAIFKSISILVDDGSTTTTLTKNSLKLGQTSTIGAGKFYVDLSGNTSASGTLGVFGDTNLIGGVVLGDSIADSIRVTGILSTINISDNTSATTTISNNSLTLGIAANYNAGVFSVNDQGIVKASGTITAIGITSSGSLTVNGNSTLGDSDAAGGDTARIYGALSMGVAPTGNAQVYLKASSTTAVPLLIQDNNGSSSTIINGSSFILGKGTSSYNSGVFNIDSNGNVTTSGTLNLRNTTDSISGVIYKGTSRFIHNFALAGTEGENTFVGVNAGNFTMTGSVGTQGSYNVAVGGSSLFFNTTGYWNTANGYASLYNNTTGNNNTANGYQSLFNNNTGYYNTANGVSALYNNTTGYYNTANGVSALASNTTGADNTAVGFQAGYNSDVSLQIFTSSTFIGSNANASVNGLTNVIVIGSTAQATASNQVVLGNSSITQTLLRGNVGIGVAPTGNAQLFIKASSTTAVPLLIQDNSGNIISQFSSSSVEAIVNGAQVTVNGYSLLSLGHSGSKAGALSIRAANSTSPGAIVLYRDASAIGAQLTPGTLIVSGGGSGSTSTLDSLNLTIAQQTNYNKGVFYVDNNGNASVSGTLRVFGSTTTGGGLKITATNSTTTITSSISGSGIGAFVLDTSSVFAANASNILLSVRNGGNKQFSIDTSGNVKAVGSFTTDPNPGDFAEVVNLAVGEEAEPGDVLTVNAVGLNQFRKSTSAYARNVAGVISDTGKFIIGEPGSGKATMALAGLVKTKVSDENGPINAGDYLVSASLPGYAMKFDSASGKTAGIVGMALEPLTADIGKIMILVNKSPIGGGGNAVGLNVSQNSSGQLVQSGDLDLDGYSILNVKKVVGQNNKWMIDEDGYLIAKVTTKEGDKKLYGLQSGQDKELVLSGSAQLENGLKKIELPLIDQEVIDPTAVVKVSVTLTGEANGVFVSEKNYQGFIVKELGGGTSNASFDWMLIAKRRATDYQEPTVEAPAPTATDEVASSTPSEASAPAPIETPAETPSDTSPTTIIEEVPSPVTEQASSPIEASPAVSVVVPTE
ncbi:MAG: hypothetical protein HZC05_03340 [Candidatus Magasanikbacteria bacterium]|nr:hypothetical protein [Candidatus Magasanikbacteria bacterium]